MKHCIGTHAVCMMQEASVGATNDDDMRMAQHDMHNHDIIHQPYNNMALATLVPSTLAAQLERVVPWRRWMDATIRLPGVRLHLINVHLHPDGRDRWRTDLAELQEHIAGCPHADAFIIGGGYNANMGRDASRGGPASLLQGFFEATRARPPATSAPTWMHWDERDEGHILGAITGARHNTTTIRYETGGWGEMGENNDHAPVAATLDVTTRPPRQNDRTRRTPWGPRDAAAYSELVRQEMGQYSMPSLRNSETSRRPCPRQHGRPSNNAPARGQRCKLCATNCAIYGVSAAQRRRRTRGETSRAPCGACCGSSDACATT